MINGIQLIAVVAALILSYFSYLHLKRNEFTIKEYFGWQLVWVAFAAATLFPDAFKVLAGQFGAFRPLDFFTVLGFVVVLSISFYTYVYLDRVRKKLDRTIQELALQDIIDPTLPKLRQKKKTSR
jgi:hypothetical protein